MKICENSIIRHKSLRNVQKTFTYDFINNNSHPTGWLLLNYYDDMKSETIDISINQKLSNFQTNDNTIQ